MGWGRALLYLPLFAPQGAGKQSLTSERLASGPFLWAVCFAAVFENRIRRSEGIRGRRAWGFGFFGFCCSWYLLRALRYVREERTAGFSCGSVFAGFGEGAWYWLGVLAGAGGDGS
jgi:hypothetical protein